MIPPGVDRRAIMHNDFVLTGPKTDPAGMGATVNIANAIDTYVISSHAPWISFRNKGNLPILVKSDAGLFNQYGVIRVNPERQPHVDVISVLAFIEWLNSPEGRNEIARFRVKGKQLFFPNYTSRAGS
jgi:tungstate transport system substrate-binding protein